MNAITDITRPQLQKWLIQRVGEYLEMSPDDLDPDSPLAELGLDSVYALALCGDVEDAFGITVEPTLAWDHPTVTALAGGILDDLHRAKADR
ncbi:acyl carrier protein [Streptomyces sp. G5(2025)]|uniref:acyl carrier protein n=1 Tax=Streptomyces sp. G5(2025) TaxID=3406628 RepID=UPI003C1331D0